MLGRLFKSKSSLSVDENIRNQIIQTSSEGTSIPDLTQNVTESPFRNVNINTYEDSYTREILYGTSDLGSSPILLNPLLFRLIVSQDGGNLRSKQVLYDSAIESLELNGTSVASLNLNTSSRKPRATSFARGSSPGPPGTSFARGNSPGPSGIAAKSAARPIHNINDLTDYMFGRGLPSVDQNISTKIHMLPPLNMVSPESSSAVLVTKLFSIADSSANGSESVNSLTTDWDPQATFPTRDPVFQIRLPSAKPVYISSESALSSRSSSFSSRFAVAIVIPLEDTHESIEEVLSGNWEMISHYLIVLQRLVCKKLALGLKASLTCNSSPFLGNKRIQFPGGILQNETDIGNQLSKLVRLVHYCVNTPKLLSTNALMTYSLNHIDSRFKMNVVNWALEVINWLEFKDGRTASSHPASGSAISQNVPQNSNLSQSNSSMTSWYRPSENPVISNTFLASLLALIMPLRESLSSGPLHVDSNNRSESKMVTRIVVMTSNSSVAKKLIFILSGLIPDATFSHKLENEVIPPETKNTDNRRRDSISSQDSLDSVNRDTFEESGDGGISFMAKSMASKPIPIRSCALASDSLSGDSVSACASVSSTKGWDAPQISATGLSFRGQKTSETTHVTVAQQIPNSRRVSASGPSSLAYLSSSLNSSLSSSASNYSLSRLGSSFMDKWRSSLVGASKVHPGLLPETFDGPITSDTLQIRSNFTIVKSPSPAEEMDEPIWEDSSRGSFANSPFHQKISRAQSLLNLANGLSTIKPALSDTAVGADRTRTAFYVPPMSESSVDVESANRDIIHDKVRLIMQSELHHHMGTDQALILNPVTESESLSTSHKDSGSSTDESCDDLPGTIHKKAYLKPHVAFVDEFRPEYTIQSCPVNPRLEAHVFSSMKNDLLFYQNNCGFENITTKTIFVGLRAREIKVIEMSVGHQKRGMAAKTTGAPVSPAAMTDIGNSYFSHTATSSPTSSYFPVTDYSGSLSEKRDASGANNFRTSVKKIYTPNRNSGDKQLIQKVEVQLEKLNEVASLISSNSAETSDTKELYNRMLFNAVRELIT